MNDGAGRWSVRAYRKLALCATALAVLAGLRWSWEGRRIRVLFAGPKIICEATDAPWRQRCVYRVTGTGLPLSVPSHTAPRRVDGVTGASVLRRVCSPSVYRERMPSQRLLVTHPTNGAVFPPNLCAPFIEWQDEANDVWQVRIEIEGLDLAWKCVSRRRRWRVSSAIWRSIREHAIDRDCVIQIMGVRQSGPRDSVYVSEPVRVRVSRDPVDDYVVYRLVTPPFSMKSSPDTFVRHVGSTRTEPLLRGHGRYCFNCHVFSSQAGTSGKLCIQARYVGQTQQTLKTYLGVYDVGLQRGWKVELPFAIQMSTFTAWSPDCSKLAVSVNQQLTTLSPVIHESQSVRLPTSDIAIYGLSANAAYLLPGASGPDSLTLYPRWTPDGKSIVFCFTPKVSRGVKAKLDLRVVPFNGGRGGKPTSIPGASNNGRSNYYPRFSPDGKWLSFCQSDGGSLIKPSSDIYLLPGDLRGPARRLECNAALAADSWHSWSSNSRWLVFASKRDDGIYARLYLAHIDEGGRASPAVRLPVAQPPLASFNIPELLAKRPQIPERGLFEAIRIERPAVSVQEGQTN